MFWARQITKRSAPPAKQVIQLAESLAKQFGVRNQQVLVSNEIQRPMLWGFARATIVLPATYQTWSDRELLSVLSHELAHASRGDHWTKIFVQCVLAVYWFHPLVRWLDRLAESMAEQSADDLCIASGRKGRDLSECLVKFATSHSLTPIALQFASYRDLRNRIERLMSGRYSTWRIGYFGRTIQLALAVGASLSLATFLGLWTPSIAIAKQIVTSAPNRKAMGRVVDANGNPVSDAMILRSQSRKESLPAMTDRDGKFAIDFESDGLSQEHLWIFKAGYNLKVISPSLSPNGIQDCSVKLSPADVTKVSVIREDETLSSTAIVEHPQIYVPNGVYESNASTGMADYIPTKIASQIVVPVKPDGCFEIRGIPTELRSGIQVTDHGVTQSIGTWAYKSKPIKLLPTGNIKGLFVNYKSSGLQISPSCLFIRTSNSSGYSSGAFVDLNEDGSFEVRNQIAGLAILYFLKFDQNADWQPIPISAPTVVAGAEINLDIQLSKVTKAKGRVIDAASLKPTKAMLSVFPTQPKIGVGCSIETDEDGRFEFKVPPGDWTLQIESRQIGEKSYESTTIDFHVTTDNPELNLADIEVEEIALKDVGVVDTQGKPITKGTVVLAYSHSGLVQCFGKLDEEGFAEIAIPVHRPSESFWVLYPEDKPIRSVDAREMPKLKFKSLSPLILTFESPVDKN